MFETICCADISRLNNNVAIPRLDTRSARFNANDVFGNGGIQLCEATPKSGTNRF